MEPCMGFHFSLSAADDIDDVAATIPDHIGEWLDQRAHWQHQAIATICTGTFIVASLCWAGS